MRNIVATGKFILFALLCLVVVPPQILLLFMHRGRHAYLIPRIFHRSVCAIFRIKVIISGSPPDQETQYIYVSNHLSYLDIPVIGSCLRASFVAKEDVSGWPVFGFLSKMQQTLFISRERNKASDGQANLDQALKSGKSIILFPEGTSTDGQSVFPFKSSLFSLAYREEEASLCIRPFTINMIEVEGRQVKTQADRDYYAWHIKMDTSLDKHLWAFAKGTGAVIELNFHPALDTGLYSDRKELAKVCQDAVSNGLRN